MYFNKNKYYIAQLPKRRGKSVNQYKQSETRINSYNSMKILRDDLRFHDVSLTLRQNFHQ